MAFDEFVRGADRAVQRMLGGEPVTYQPDGGDQVEATGVFDEPYVLAKGGADAGVEALGPSVFLRLEDLPEDPQDEAAEPTITIRGNDYRVTERRPDGMGGIVLGLRLVE